MNLKSFLKAIKLNESTISMALGALVIVVVGVLVVNYFKKADTGTTFPNAVQTENKEIDLPTIHKVSANESLWSISEKYYGTGYNWVDIAEANDLSRADIISEGQEINIPDVPSRALGSSEATPSATAQPEKIAEVTPEPTPTITPTPKETAKPEIKTPEPTVTESGKAITSGSYTVVHGDTLWDIAVKAYGDGYRWTEIAKANKLANPNIIHSGNVLVLPR